MKYDEFQKRSKEGQSPQKADEPMKNAPKQPEPAKGFKTFTAPSKRKDATGAPVEPTCKVWEPHAYNAHRLAKQRAAGQPANIPSPPMARTHKTMIKAPNLVSPHDFAARNGVNLPSRSVPVEDVLPGELGENDEEILS